jgi:sec-independent protein translocase protein TatA
LQGTGFVLTLVLLKTKIMGNLGFQEILLIAVVVLVLFGGRKIPEFMRGLGKGIREFNDAKDNVKKELEEGIKEKDKTPVA